MEIHYTKSKYFLIFKLFVVAIFLILSLPSISYGASITWDGGGSDGTCGGGVGDGNKWSCAANWSTDSVPTSSDSVVFDSTSIKDAKIDASFQGTITGFTISSGYDGTITQERTLIINGSYSQADGFFVGGSQSITLNSDGAVSITGGTFTSTTGTLSLERNFTVSGSGVFVGNGGTVTFVANIIFDATVITCGDATFSTVVFNKDGGAGTNTITVSAGCTIPLGNNAESRADTIINNGTINVGTGTWTIHGNYTQNSGSVLTMGGTAMVLDTNGSLTLNGGTFPAGLTTLSVERNLDNTGNLLPDGITLTVTDYQTQDATTLTCGDVTFGSVVFNKDDGGAGTNTITVGADCTIPLGNSAVSSADTIINNGTINVGTGTWTIHGSYTQNSGSVLTMSGTAMVVDTDGSLTLNGGTFPAGLTTLSVERSLDNTGNLLPDGIALTLTNNGFNDNATLECGTVSFASITLNKDSADTTTLDSNCTTTTFTRTNGELSNPSSAYTLYVSGSISISTTDTFGGSNLTIEMNGGTSANITQNAGTFSSKLKINKTVGISVTQSTNLVLGSTLEISSGTFDQGATYSLTTGGTLTIGTDGTWKNFGTGDVTLAGNVSNSGSIDLDGSGDGCGGADEIVISSSSSPTQRTWSGAGTFSIYDVYVSDQAGSVTAVSSNDFSNNDWTFTGCNVDPDVPSSLSPASYVNGSTINDNTPTFNFGLSDSDVSNTIKYRIQIDDTSDFSSLIVDYTSGLSAQGTFSFTVGQAAGSGSYSTGSSGQTLPDSAGYYWRVKSIDENGAESAYVTANSGAVAFGVDTTVSSSVTFGNGPVVDEKFSYQIVIKSRPQIVYPDGRVVYLDINYTSTTTVQSTSKRYIFTKNLSKGQKSDDVKHLQIFLNNNGFVIANTGPGSPGNETDYFGSLTFLALIKFQNAYADVILKPLSLTKGTGFFGGKTRDFVNSN